MEQTLPLRKILCSILVPRLLGQFLRQGGGESEAILTVMQLHVSDQPVPIEVCENERKPRQTLDDTHLQVRFVESGEENLRRVVSRSSTPTEVGKARITESGEFSSQ